jgi:hypothetical protein
MVAAQDDDEPIPNRSDAHKAARNVALRYSGHEAAMLGEMIRAKRKAEKIQKFAATGNEADLEFTAEEEADMAVNLGNEYHYHITQPGAVATQPTQPPSTPTTPTQPSEPCEPIKPEVIRPEIVKPEVVKPEVVNPVIAPVANGGKMLPAMVLLGALGMGGVGAGCLAIWDRMWDRPPATADTDTDTDTIVELDFPTT